MSEQRSERDGYGRGAASNQRLQQTNAGGYGSDGSAAAFYFERFLLKGEPLNCRFGAKPIAAPGRVQPQ